MKLEKKQKMILSIVFFMFLIFSIFSVNSYAGTQSWNSLDYDVTLNEDGSMDVIETWDVDISSTNTMFKTFEDTYYDDYDIVNARVSRVHNGQETFLTEIHEEQYHVTSGCYYGLRINSNEFEIAWNVGLDNSSATRCYKIYYTVKDVIKKYDDCSELYWQFLSDNNTMTGRNVTGRIRLSKSVSDIEKLRVWGHGNYSAVINRTSNSLVEFSAPGVSANEMLEVRVVIEEDVFPLSTNKYASKKIDSILQEEQMWADEANREREEAKKTWNKIVLAVIVVIIINIILLFVFIKKSKKYKQIREELIREYGPSEPIQELEYFRDIPDENNATPGKAVYLKEFRKNSSNISSELSDIFSATILNLCLKKVIYFEAVTEKEVRIYISEDAATYENNLFEDEKIVFRLLKSVYSNKGYITIKDFNKYATREYDYFYDQMRRLERCVEAELLKDGTIDREKKAKMKDWSTRQYAYLIGAFMLFFIPPTLLLLPSLPIGLLILGLTSRKNATCISVLSYQGEEKVQMWNGLKNFMEDYSMLNERLVPDIVIWEKYLVYASAFGIASKVLKQLRIVHPEMFEGTDDYYDRNRYGYWNMVSSPRYGDNFFNSFNKSLGNVYNKAASAYSSAHSSSSDGSGGGGGFSGGGRRRRRWRKLRRSLKLKIKI